MKVVLIIFILSIGLLAQAEYVDVNNQAFNFLERMNNLGFLENYNSFEIPKIRKEIANYINQLIEVREQLDKSDQAFLEDLKVEFEYELKGTLENSESLLSSDNYKLFSEKQKYLYFFTEKSKINLFVNLIADGEIILNKTNLTEKYNASNLINIGGELHGTILDRIGFYLMGTNGIANGNRIVSLLKPELKYNYKYNEKPEERFFDETQGHITADFDLVKLKLGRDRVNIGHGSHKFLFGSSSPLYDYFAFDVQYDFFSFSYIHGKLLGNNIFMNDSIAGSYNYLLEKYFAYHRIGLDISRHMNFGIGEVVVYSDRPLDLSYLVPFSFFKSVEHSNRDRDNTMLFFDCTSNSIPNSKLFLTFLIDDINFSKIGKGWWGNQTLFNMGIHSSPFYNSFPIDFIIEYLRLEPYTYSHRLNRNNFTQYGYNLGSTLQPNSELYLIGLNYRFTNRLAFEIEFNYENHGANEFTNDGKIRNVGGDINLGHRTFDSETVKFLDGSLQVTRTITAKLFYEPYNQLSLFFNAVYYSRSGNQTMLSNDTQIFSGINLKF